MGATGRREIRNIVGQEHRGSKVLPTSPCRFLTAQLDQAQLVLCNCARVFLGRYCKGEKEEKLKTRGGS